MTGPPAEKPIDYHLDDITLPPDAHDRPVTWHTPAPEEVVPGRVWTVRGATKIKSYVDCPNTMTIVRVPATGDLLLLNAIRLDDAMNARVLALAGSPSARVHVVRLGAYHGRADSFWRDACPDRCVLWTLPGHKLQPGVSPDRELRPDALPSPDAELFVFDFPRPEAALVLRDVGVAVFCDAVLNLTSLEYCGMLWKPLIWMLGFCTAVHGPDPLWTKWMISMTSKEHVFREFERLLDTHEFDSYVGGHGVAEVGDAREKIRARIREMFS